MAGYIGYSRSVNAAIAEDDGKLPLSRAVHVVARDAGVTQKIARAALIEDGPCEWHHTSKKYNRTDFYDCGAAVRRLKAAPEIARLEALGFRSILDDGHPGMAASLDECHVVMTRLFQEMAVLADTTPVIVANAYYNDWS